MRMRVIEKLARDNHNPPRWATGDSFPSGADLAKLAPTKDLFGN